MHIFTMIQLIKLLKYIEHYCSFYQIHKLLQK